jgi:diguanylate cyclase (GGDEF)-like protein
MTVFSIYIANFLLVACYTAALWLISVATPKLRGMRLLARAYTAALIGSSIQVLVPQPHSRVISILYAESVLLCFVLLYYTFLHIAGRKPKRAWVWTGVLGGGLAAFLYTAAGANQFMLRSEITALLTGALALMSAYVLLRDSTPDIKVPARALATVLLLFSLRSLLRCVWIARFHLMPETSTDVWLQIVGASGYLVMNSFMPLGYLWMATVRMQGELEALSFTDSLTGALNRRAFDEKGRLELERSRRHLLPMSVVAMDVDRFKRLNDVYGHSGGDHALVQIAAAISGLLRTTDALAHFGGDEFVLLLPATGMEGARDLAERLRERVEQMDIQQKGERMQVTASFGVAILSGPLSDDQETDTWEALLERADTALYRAKNNGRNRVE